MRIFYMSLFVVFFMACSPFSLQPGEQGMDPGGEEGEVRLDFSDFHRIVNKTGCQDFKPYVWNYIYKVASFEKNTLPPYYIVKQKIVQRIQALMKDHPVDQTDINNFALRFVEVYALVKEFMEEHGKEEITNTLVQLEYGIESQNHSLWTNKLKKVFAELDDNAKALNNHCQDDESVYDQTQSYRPFLSENGGTGGQEIHPLVYGARKIMATAYQTCSVLNLPAMPLNFQTKGIRIHSRHPSGVGYRRVITDLKALNHSHYYLKHKERSQKSDCLNIHKNPLIYDFGGKPSTAQNSINLFKNAGSGGKALGVDCSGFVASAMASAGLRLKPRVFIRSIHVKAVNSWMLKMAHRHHLSCLKKQDISLDNPLQAGDIIASHQHTVIVDSTSPDAFRISQIHHDEQCHSRRMNTDNFNFTILQSSAHNNGTGINKMWIRDSAEGAIKRGLERVASRACYKKFGKDTHLNIKEVSILRHASQDPACRNRKIYIQNEECINDCIL